MRPDLIPADERSFRKSADPARTFLRVRVRTAEGRGDPPADDLEAWFPEIPQLNPGDELADVEAYGRGGRAFLFPRLRVCNVSAGEAADGRVQAVSVGPFYRWDFARAHAEFFPG